MPTFRQAAFIHRALRSLLAQTLTDWQLVIVDDGSPDGTADAVRPYLNDPRVTYHRLDENRGLGGALNYGLARAGALYVAYLPSDDVYYPEHLATLVAELEADPGVVLAHSSLTQRTASSSGSAHGLLQLVQVVHRRVDDRWIERDELVTDDLDRLFWAKLRPRGTFRPVEAITSEWVAHPDQMHKAIQEATGGLNRYRARYGVRHPMRFHPSDKDLIDEVEQYRRFRERPDMPRAADGLKILLVGELAYNPERVLALEERGHTLYGLWTPEPAWFNTVGPLPFGHVEDLPHVGWRDAVRRVEPDLIYALLNWQAVRFAHHVLTENPGVPFVWHFKEGPFFCLENGLWSELVELQTRSDGQIYATPEMRDWFEGVLPGEMDRARTLVLDGDLPKREWFGDDRRPKLSELDGEPHTVVTGRPMGIDPETVGELARAGIHTHFYGLVPRGPGDGWQAWIDRARELAPDRAHFHPTVHQGDWVSELSRYDAGWLHLFRSYNRGDLRRAAWDDLNYPARIATLAAAGLPWIQSDNSGALVATQSLARRLDVGLFFRDATDLADQLRDRPRMARLHKNAWRHRRRFTFDHHADRLVRFFRRVIDRRRS